MTPFKPFTWINAIWASLAQKQEDTIMDRLKLLKSAIEEYKITRNILSTITISIDERTEIYFPKTGIRTYELIDNKQAQITSISTHRLDGKASPILVFGEPIIIEAQIMVFNEIEKMNMSIMVHDAWVKFVSATHSAMIEGFPVKWKPGEYKVRMTFPKGIINCGQYGVRAGLGWIDNTIYDYHNDGLGFEIISPDKIEPHTIHSHGLLAILPDYSLVDNQ